MLIALLGALLILLGILYLAVRAIRRRRLSATSPAQEAAARIALEPPGQVRGFRFGENWPGLVPVALGAALLIGLAAVPTS